MVRTISIRVLVIDDDQAVCRKVSAWLREAGLDAVTFTEPEAGLQHIAQAPCQVALIDLRLADAVGTEVIRRVQECCPRAGIAALAAFPDADQVIESVRAGARDVIAKPVQQETLLAAVQRLLRQVGLTFHSEEEFNQRLGARLRAARAARNLKLADVAGACDLTAAQLSHIELGRSATTTWTLARVCAVLGIAPADVLREM